MEIQKDFQVLLYMWSKVLKNRFWCLLILWNVTLSPDFCSWLPSDTQTHHYSPLDGLIDWWSCLNSCVITSGTQHSLLRKKIYVKEGKKMPRYLLVSFWEVALTSPSWAPGWSYYHAWKPRGPLAGDLWDLLKASHKSAPQIAPPITGFHTFSPVACSKQRRRQPHAPIDLHQLHDLPPSEHRVLGVRTYLVEMADCHALSWACILLKV